MVSKLCLSTLLLLSIAASAKTIEMSEYGSDVKIPIQIWNQIGPVGGKESVSFFIVKVRLVEKTPGVLVDPEVEIKFPRGGGEIDLADFVKNQQGTFRVFFDLEDVPMGMNDESHAYFISHTRKRKLDGEVWGAGCNKYMDIKKYISGEGRTKGIEVNTTRARHVSVLGGTFFFSSGKQVTQVTFKDTQQERLFCESTKAE